MGQYMAETLFTAKIEDGKRPFIAPITSSKLARCPETAERPQRIFLMEERVSERRDGYNPHVSLMSKRMAAGSLLLHD